MKYIKKFESVSAADNYAIIDIPFITTIERGVGDLINLACNQENKKIVVDGDNIDIVDAGPKLISFTIDNIPYQAEEGMTWGEWVESKYNTGGFYFKDVKGLANCIYNGSKYIVE